uniref:Zinc finger protein 687 n=1 Tax=Acanthochromis polyacanthus TaxID=80966 RepID=A0A3Q1FUU0_9TELE
MGDMKTPDFDDLLAAFDIPDIDAKEAIQSSPEEDNQDEERTNAEKRDGGSPSCFPGPPASQSDPPVVSVIVKNTVRSESFEEEEVSVRDKTDNSPRSDSASHDFTTQGSPKPSTEASTEPQIANGLEKSKSNIEPWSQSSPLKSTLDESDKGAKAGSVQHTADVINDLKPLLYPQDSITTGPTSPPPPSGSPHLSPPSSGNPRSSPLPQNDKTGVKLVMHTDEDDSEPDLGSPLVIQESPEPVMSSPPKFRHRAKLPPDLLRSPEIPPTLTNPQQEKDGTKPSSPPSDPQPQSSQDSLPPVSSTSIHEEKYPEHVIDERDSPESPPPSETGLVVPNRSSSPSPAVKELQPQEDPEDTEELKEKAAGDEEKLNEKSCDAAAEPVSVAEAVSPPLGPLKVKIKTPIGSITRTVTGAAPKRSKRASRKSGFGSKPAAERQNTRSKRKPSAEMVLQNAETKTAKAKVSAAAVNITKTAALPSISSSRSSPGSINLRSLGQKTINSGMMLPTPLPLLPPQTSSRPASIVNSTGAIISKSQTNLVDAFNKILNNKNLLPSYKPDLSAPLPAEWGISLPVQGFRCLECGDAFALEQSLAQHYDRRSLRIEVTCNHCAKRLAFFNKCSLLLHAREHKERGLIMQCSHLVMKPVPVEQMVSQQEHVAPAKAMPKPTLHKASEAAHSGSVKCPECQAQFSSKEEVAEHFQEIRPAHSTPCPDCSPPMLLPNGCSSAAHQRIHQSCSPHVCPECGETAKQALFRTHLEEACLHFSRRIGYRCSSCLVVFGGLNSVKSHMQQAHCDTFHKCPSCPMAFKSAPSIQSHISAQHPTLAQGQPMLIYKCVTCDTVFTQKPLLHAHFDTHLTNQKVHVFKCPECTKLFSQRSSLLDHFKTHKASSLKEPSSPPASSSSRPSESSDGEELTHEDEKVKTEKIKRPSSWNCLSCHTRYTDQDDYINHMREKHGKKLKKFPCNKCENSFTTPSNLTRHIRDKHKAANGGLQCQFCTDGEKTFSSRVMLERHVLLTHIMDCVNQDTLTEGGDEADSSSEQDGGSVGRRRRRGAANIDRDEESAGATSPVKKPRPDAPPEPGLRCAPCGFTTEDQAAFLEHIGQHRRSGSEGGGLQCLQCGACFTSTSSLSRHRFITHKVKEAFGDAQQPSPSPGKSRNHEDRGSLNGSAPASPSGQPDEDGALACKQQEAREENQSGLHEGRDPLDAQRWSSWTGRKTKKL